MTTLGQRNWLNSRSVVAFLFFLLVGVWLLRLGCEQLLAWQLRRFDADVTFIHGEVTGVSFRDSAHTFGVRGQPSAFGDDDLPLLKSFRSLQYLGLEDTSVTNAGLAEILQFPKLTRLDVCAEQITPERERELNKVAPHIAITKIHFVDGIRVADGYHQ